MTLAIQDHLLPGNTLQERLEVANQLGVAGIEFTYDESFLEQLPIIAASLESANLRAAAVNLGHTHLIHPDFAIREQAIVRFREAMTVAVDLKAQGIIFHAHYQPTPVLPDLHPYKSSVELEAEMVVAQLNATLCDLAYAIGTQLILAPANHTKTQLIRKVSHAVTIRRELKDHPHLSVVANTYHMQMESEDIIATLGEFADDITYVHLRGADGGLPTESNLDLPAILSLIHI